MVAVVAAGVVIKIVSPRPPLGGWWSGKWRENNGRMHHRSIVCGCLQEFPSARENCIQSRQHKCVAGDEGWWVVKLLTGRKWRGVTEEDGWALLFCAEIEETWSLSVQNGVRIHCSYSMRSTYQLIKPVRYYNVSSYECSLWSKNSKLFCCFSWRNLFSNLRKRYQEVKVNISCDYLNKLKKQTHVQFASPYLPPKYLFPCSVFFFSQLHKIIIINNC